MEVVKTCQCTKGDYECDLHYYKSAEGKEAVCAWDPAQGAISSAVEVTRSAGVGSRHPILCPHLSPVPTCRLSPPVATCQAKKKKKVS